MSGNEVPEPPVCPYCSALSVLTKGDVIYPSRPDLAEKLFWRCAPCDAYVGCHQNTPMPLGRLANHELRRAKMQAHIAFDPIWHQGLMRRSAAYRWLAEQLGIKEDDCHIGMFDIEMCKKVQALSEEYRAKKSDGA